LAIREIYSAHNVYYKFSVLAVNIGTRPDRLLQWSIFESGHYSDFPPPLMHAETLGLSNRCHLLSHE